MIGRFALYARMAWYESSKFLRNIWGAEWDQEKIHGRDGPGL